MSEDTSWDILDALADEAARYEEEEGKPTPESRAAAQRYRSMIDDRLAAMRRADLEQLEPAQVARGWIRPDLLEMTRDKLVAYIRRLQDQQPALGFAHRSLRNVSDDDLRTMIEDIESTMEDES